MKELFKDQKAKVYFIGAAFFAAITVFLRAYSIPFNHDEVATFFHFVQPGDIYPFDSEIDANNHFLNSLFTRFSFLLFGDHPFALRMANVLSLFVLIYAVFRLCRIAKTAHSQNLLVFFFLIPFYWLAFFAFCRGYGISMAFLLLALSYFNSFLESQNTRSFGLFILFMQIALSANLILIVPLIILTSIIALQQFEKRILFRGKSILLHLLNAIPVLFWFYYSVYLKDHGALYYGAGDSYWEVAFITLSFLLTNIHGPVVLIGFMALITFLAFLVIRKSKINLSNHALIYLIVLVLHVLAFYLMKVIMDVNYPEDRTGLFFFVFAGLFIAFSMDYIPVYISKLVTSVIVILVFVHTLINWNINRNDVPNYEIIPERFYTRLLDEQKLRNENSTISGYRMKELIYDFMNYRNNGPLNLLDPVETMHAYSDYYIGDKRDSTFWSNYYNVIEEDEIYGYVLLKRKELLKKVMVSSRDTTIAYNGSGEYFTFFENKGISIDSTLPALAELDIAIEEAPLPFKAWIVFEVNDENGNRKHYSRWPLNWTKYDWNSSSNRTITLTTSAIPLKTGTIICYLWNMKKMPVKLKSSAFRLYLLKGKGADDFIPE